MEQVAADVLVVGAGLAGLMAAHVLQEQGVRVTLVDKGRSVGGRLATRRVGLGKADYGAQFFTVRSPEFQLWVDRWIADGLVYRWSTGWSDGSLASAAADGHARYAVQGGMNALAKHLAQGLDTRVNVRLVGVSPDCGGWRSEDKGGRMYVSQALLLTPPVPQSLALLDAGGVKLEPEDRGILEYIEYAPCLAGLFQIDGSVNLPEPGALQRPEAAISWISDNRRKGISPDDTIITVHAGPDYSQRLFARPEAETLAELEAGLRPFLDQQTVIVEAQLKRWRYALPRVFHSGRCLVATGLPTLVFAGDAFGGPRIEGAALSGLFAGKVIGERFSIPSGL